MSVSESSRNTFRMMLFLRFLIVGATFPAISLWAVEQWDNKELVGYLMGVIALASLLGQQMWGYLADMVWPRRRILLMNIAAAMVLLAINSQLTSVSLFLLTWFCIAFFMTPINPMMNAIIMGSEHGRGQYSGIRAWGTVGFVFACFGSGLFADRYGTNWVAYPLALIGGTLTWLWFWKVHTPHVPPKRHVPFIQVQRFFLSRRHFVWFILALFLNRFAHGPMMLFQMFRAKDLAPVGWENRAATSLFVVGSIAEVLVFFFGDRLLRRFGELRLLAWATGIAVVRFALVPLLSLPWLISLNVLHAATFGLFYLASVSWMHRHTPEPIKTSAQTLHTMIFFGLSPLLGNPLFGRLYERFGDTHQIAIFWGGSLVILASMILLIGAMRAEPVGPPEKLPIPGETPAGQ